MTLTQLEIFAVVAARQSFTLAAAQLNISQSGVSHAVRALEQELGVALFERRQARIELSDIGTRLLQRAQAMLGLAETMRQEALDARGMKQGTLRIGSFGPTASVRLLPAILAAYRRAYPGIEVHVDEGPDRQVRQWLLERRIDVGFVVLPEEPFDTYPLLEDQMLALMPNDHGLAQQPAVRLEQLCHDPFVLTEAGSAEIVSRLFVAAKLQPRIRYRTSQLLSTLAMVARGEGLSIVAESSLPLGVARDLALRALDPPVKRVVGLAVVDERIISPATRAFIELARTLPRNTAD
ncbi:LysR family transcriptional regulator [Pseudomonas rubra]|uniref:LysR substrate-binding domain-containing protein n=1 Tax=Pseudomonas rubra TaxID=2942627 RepID=A0ABT5P8Y9_9PSED|nr:LysR substrate-binding domain-containing protein [Pseudomonas rubra]MDD1014769.1 LysR substrate-binding domain-containing protein [Pseudomonas rubra]MDD1040782.1 LysR substrate-binding domain-containing protein [Pseudomonas rubra]MDD1157688.1 LysR substrate-binding domain-containing protein [Pseudomonas rubra]